MQYALLAVVVAGILWVMLRMRREWDANAPLREQVLGQAVIFQTQARIRVTTRRGSGFLKGGGRWPSLIVRTESIEISRGTPTSPFNGLLGAARYLDAHTTTMTACQVQLTPSPGPPSASASPVGT